MDIIKHGKINIYTYMIMFYQRLLIWTTGLDLCSRQMITLIAEQNGLCMTHIVDCMKYRGRYLITSPGKRSFMVIHMSPRKEMQRSQFNIVIYRQYIQKQIKLLHPTTTYLGYTGNILFFHLSARQSVDRQKFVWNIPC